MNNNEVILKIDCVFFGLFYFIVMVGLEDLMGIILIVDLVCYVEEVYVFIVLG